MKFNSLLRDAAIDPKSVSVILHLTSSEPLRTNLPILVDQYPDLWDAFQSVHSPQAAATLSNRKFAASFVPIERGIMVFVGLFAITTMQDLPVSEIYADPRFSRLEVEFGNKSGAPDVNIARGGFQRRFGLVLRDELREEIGRLRIAAPGTRSYVQLAANLDPDVVELTKRRNLCPPLPHWTRLILTKDQVLNLHRDWFSAMSQWRGIYLITDMVDGARYVGSAYGEENIIGRWKQHVVRQNGITNELRHRQTDGLQFSILEILRHNDLAEDVIQREHSWMNRLNTRVWGLNQ